MNKQIKIDEKHFFKRVLQDIKRGENLDLYVTIVLSLSVLVASALGLSSPALVNSLILAVLSLVSITLLGNRHRLEQMQNQISSKNGVVFSDEDSSVIYSQIEYAQEIWLFGETLSGTVYRTRETILQKLNRGHLVRVFVIKPDSVTAELSANRHDSRPARQVERIKQTLEWLDDARLQYSENLEVRVTSHLLSFKAFAINPQSRNGTISLEYIPFRGKTHLRFSLSSIDDNKWYQFFIAEMNAIWEQSEPFS